MRKTAFSQGISEGDKLALSDPQTSGGLLIALPPKRVRKFEKVMEKEKMPYWVIGEVVKGRGTIKVE